MIFFKMSAISNIIGKLDPPDGVPIGNTDVAEIIGNILTAIYAVAGVITVGMIILGGYNMMISSGDPEKLRKGQDTVTYALIGVVAIIASALIFEFIANLLGVEDLLKWFSFELST